MLEWDEQINCINSNRKIRLIDTIKLKFGMYLYKKSPTSRNLPLLSCNWNTLDLIKMTLPF